MDLEFNQGLLGTCALLPSILFSIFSWFGGRDRDHFGIRSRLWGRIVAPFSFCLLVVLLSFISEKFHKFFLFSLPAYLIASSMGYGGDRIWKKIVRRSIWSFVMTAASLTFAISTGAWTFFILQLVVGFISTIILGILNPLKAPQEEGLIKFISVVFVPFMVL